MNKVLPNTVNTHLNDSAFGFYEANGKFTLLAVYECFKGWIPIAALPDAPGDLYFISVGRDRLTQLPTDELVNFLSTCPVAPPKPAEDVIYLQFSFGWFFGVLTAREAAALPADEGYHLVTVVRDPEVSWYIQEI